MKLPAFLSLAVFLLTISRGAVGLAAPSDSTLAARAVNSLGLKLLERSGPTNANLLLSPYSIQNALAMTWAGADGLTWKEMARVLDFGTNETALHGSLGELGKSLDTIRQQTETQASVVRKQGGTMDPLTLVVANRLFGERSFSFRPTFLALTRDRYGAALEPLDFRNHPEKSRLTINRWVSTQTRERIPDLIPQDALDRDARLVLVNAIYLKAPWAKPFSEQQTHPKPFHLPGETSKPVPTMNAREHLGYRHQKDFSAITLPYTGGGLQFLVLLPDTGSSLAALERTLTAEALISCAQLPRVELDLHLPKLHLEPPVMKLGKALRDLGMTTAFDIPPGSANFDRMAAPRSKEKLKISDVFHQTFLDLDEKGTEAAAATAVLMVATSALPTPKPKPIVVRVDRPFLFAIQHRSSGACLFLGRIVDPR
jgi:serpin B